MYGSSDAAVIVGGFTARGALGSSVIADARDGSVEAFTLLTEHYHGAILRYLLHQCGDRELAADLTQETFLDAFRSLRQLPDNVSFAAWLYRIARNNLLAELRRQRVRRLVSLDGLLEKVGVVAPALRDGGQVGSYAERDAIDGVLAELSPALREALVLHSVWGFSSREVAMILSISPDAAKRRIGRAKEQFTARHRAITGELDDVPV